MSYDHRNPIIRTFLMRFRHGLEFVGICKQTADEIGIVAGECRVHHHFSGSNRHSDLPGATGESVKWNGIMS